ncbi:MAG: sspB [Gammaproteobacteria bacterium]|jgi:stringent starvation protein B|nr:sspB [Gammaproteobacteria bacterium]
MTSTRPYLLRAFYEWMCDNEFTPYIVLNADMPEVEVPRQFVENGQIILNISPEAVDELELGNDNVSFQARFSGVPRTIAAPVKAVLAIYAHENGQGVVFSEEEVEEEGDDETPPPAPTKTSGKGKGKANLRIVK